MRTRITLLLLALSLLLPSGCQTETTAPEGDYLIYFLAESGMTDSWAVHGPALKTQPWSPALPMVEPGPTELVRALLAGPTQEGLRSPFPKGVSLLGWEWDGENQGNLRLRLSEQYSGLTDISLTLADYAIALTLSQIERVETVEIFTSSYSVSYRSHQILNAKEAMLSDPMAEGGSS